MLPGLSKIFRCLVSCRTREGWSSGSLSEVPSQSLEIILGSKLFRDRWPSERLSEVPSQGLGIISGSKLFRDRRPRGSLCKIPSHGLEIISKYRASRELKVPSHIPEIISSSRASRETSFFRRNRISWARELQKFQIIYQNSQEFERNFNISFWGFFSRTLEGLRFPSIILKVQQELKKIIRMLSCLSHNFHRLAMTLRGCSDAFHPLELVILEYFHEFPIFFLMNFLLFLSLSWSFFPFVARHPWHFWRVNSVKLKQSNQTQIKSSPNPASDQISPISYPFLFIMPNFWFSLLSLNQRCSGS